MKIKTRFIVKFPDGRITESERFVKVSLEQLRHGADVLASKIIKEKGKPGRILGIGRGSMVLSRLLSDALGVNKVSLVKVMRYGEINKPNSRINVGEMPNELAETDGYILIVDDVSDKGHTFKIVTDAVKRYLEGIKERRKLVTCSFAVKSGTIFKPDFYLMITDKSKWIIYEYEISEFLKSFKASNDAEGIDFIKRNFSHAKH